MTADEQKVVGALQRTGARWDAARKVWMVPAAKRDELARALGAYRSSTGAKLEWR